MYVIVNSSFGAITAMGNEESLTKYKSALTNAIVGLILVFMAFMIVNTVVNFMLTRHLASQNPKCKLDLTSPLTYLSIDPKDCSSLPDTILHPPTATTPAPTN